MKNLKNLGNVLSAAEMKNINGSWGGNPTCMEPYYVNQFGRFAHRIHGGCVNNPNDFSYLWNW
ncbi:hypothetical protein [Winogradskyella sp.]|uniref:hypothetical protein n=1 Tax=Winogradskyella sp. TaxID=1883156 RepID=UPI002629C931|nr:hypothetical protein [Winogradskyella sp.]